MVQHGLAASVRLEAFDHRSITSGALPCIVQGKLTAGKPKNLHIGFFARLLFLNAVVSGKSFDFNMPLSMHVRL